MRILLVEDDCDLVFLTREAFEDINPDVQITEASDGASALEMLAHDRFDIVILDYTLPGMNGVEVLQKIKEMGISIPVIMVSGQKNEEIIRAAMNAGAQDYIFKTPSYHGQLFSSAARAVEENTNQRVLKEGPEKRI